VVFVGGCRGGIEANGSGGDDGGGAGSGVVLVDSQKTD